MARAEPPRDAAAPVPRPRLPGLRARLLAAGIFLPCFTIIAWRGEIFFVILVVYIALAGTLEFQRLLAAKGIRPQWSTALAGAVLLPWISYWRGGAYTDCALALLVLCSMTLELWRPAGDSLVRTASAILGVLYVAWLASHLVLLRELPRLTGAPYRLGFELVILVFLLAWMSDTGAYAVGSLVGRHKLAPRISPGKSIEGAAGGLVFAVAAGVAASLTFLGDALSPLAGAGLGLLAAVAAQVGDLAESQLKRDARVKDTSGAIPGHGGTLDRFDSVLFAAPLVYYVLRFFAS